MDLSHEQQHWRDLARQFATDELNPRSLERDQIDDPVETFDWELVRRGSRIGLRTLATSPENGGHGVDFVTQALVMMELSRADSAMAKTFSQNWKWSGLIEASCTPEQRERFLGRFVEDDECLLGWAGTEPGSGSDGRVPVADPRAGWIMRATRDGDDWVLNGTKQFIANGSVAKIFFVPTRTDRTVELREGVTLFLLPIDELEGVRIGRVHDKTGWRYYQNAEIVFENCRVPDSYRIGEVNGGLGPTGRGADRSGFGDLELAAHAVGVCDAAIDMALEHARGNERDGRALIEDQMVRVRLSEMDMLTEALRALTLTAARECDAGVPLNNSTAMNLAAATITRVTDLNMDVIGAASIEAHLGAEKLVRDATIWGHLAGDSVQRMKSLAKLVRKRAA